MKRNFIIAFWICLAGITGAQTGDTLLTIDDISFKSKLEEETIRAFLDSGKADYLKLFSVSSGIDNISDYENLRNRFIEFYKKNPKDKINQYAEGKKIKTIYKEVHSMFFIKYNFETSFKKIFENGEFNCLTATALYAIILNELRIPFTVAEKPEHVYLVAYPGVSDIKIETTDPLSGYHVYDETRKKAYLEYLRGNKIISEQEFGQASVDVLFNKYFFSDNKIGLKELVGLHYYNLAIYKIDQQKYKEGYEYLERAYIFYPSERIKYSMLNILVELIKDHTYNDISDLNYFVRICRFSNLITPENVRGEFAAITYNHLISKGNLDYYEDIYSYLISAIKNSEFKKEISFIYNYEKGRYFLGKGNIENSHENFANAYFIKPGHIDAQTTFVQTLVFSLSNLQAKEALNKIEGYYNSDSTLSNNSIFMKLLMHAYLACAFESFTLQEVNLGERYLTKFEKMADNNQNISLDFELVGDAYSSAGIYYFKKGNYTKAREFINKGLIYAPGSFKLIMSRNSF